MNQPPRQEPQPASPKASAEEDPPTQEPKTQAEEPQLDTHQASVAVDTSAFFAGERFFLMALVLTVLLIAVTVFWTESSTGTIHSSLGKVRNIDSEKIRRQMIRGQLSDREALYYHKTK